MQLLQLVHGRADDSLRPGTTLEALDALPGAATSGARTPPPLDESYRLLRTLEHRIQLYRLRRTHLMPTAEEDLRRLGRGLGLRGEPVAVLAAVAARTRREVRRLHEQLFYRPLLRRSPGSTAEARLAPEAAGSGSPRWASPIPPGRCATWRR